MKRKLTHLEAFTMAQILGQEQSLGHIAQVVQHQVQVLAVQKQAILKAYGLPLDKPFHLDERTLMIHISDDSKES